MSVKYPRTLHLPWSPGRTSDDKVMPDTHGLVGPLVVTEKMDGGNFTMTSEGCYSRSPSANHQPWDGPARAVWASVARDLPPGWRFCGESMHARRSVAYSDLPGPFLLFGIFDVHGTLVSWAETEEWAELLGLPMVPSLYRGEDLVRASGAWSRLGFSERDSEGYVVRCAGAIGSDEFGRRVGKWVRSDHVRTSADWRRRDDFAVNGCAM